MMAHFCKAIQRIDELVDLSGVQGVLCGVGFGYAADAMTSLAHG
jgi:hypothetical protein